VGRRRAAASTPPERAAPKWTRDPPASPAAARHGRPDAGGRRPDRLLGIRLRQIDTGLVDFPALVSGRPIWLCWRLGEAEVGWWHETTEGFDSRHRLEDLSDERAVGALPCPSSRAERGSTGTVMQGDRAKAYRPIPEDRRREALEDGIAAFERGDFFQAHELLEPAWMGTADLAERALYQA